MGKCFQFSNSPHIKISICGNFDENRRTNFLTNQGKNKDEDEKICENDFNF